MLRTGLLPREHAVDFKHNPPIWRAHFSGLCLTGLPPGRVSPCLPRHASDFKLYCTDGKSAVDFAR